ncbi:hypothetical protein GCM10022415_18030 [Knoellia locipacati]|uniref:Uncharacterized protein n=1 Tax=Knoellia locipacati TaxID=882824 RepID=A0A512T0N4_9MICO|nr:hypothetical protein [Knoellia locipacati]GEQ13751.1 hypothetical protein KLO01_17980 [Knoellia locipacati]
MSDPRTRAEAKAATTAREGQVADASEGEGRTAPRDRGALVRRVWPFVAMVVAALLWWPVGFLGRAEWMHLPLTQAAGGVAPLSGGELFLGSLVAAAVVSALVSSPWPRFGIAAGLTVVAWVLSDGDVVVAAGERVVLAALAGLGLLLGLAVGARATRGAVPVATFLALVSGLSPATWSRGVVLAVAVALPFWVATSDRVAPTILAVVRVVLTWLLAVVVSISLYAGFGALKVGALADPAGAAPVVGRAFVDNVRDNGLEIARTAPQVYTGWIWLAVVLAIAFVVVATALKRRRAPAAA